MEIHAQETFQRETIANHIIRLFSAVMGINSFVRIRYPFFSRYTYTQLFRSARIGHLDIMLWLVGLGLLCVLAREQVKVLNPTDLAAQLSDIEAMPALFGVPSSGVTIVGRLVGPPINNSLACDSIPYIGYRTDPSILLVDRGECLFTVKVQNAQLAGFKAVLVVNSEEDTEDLPFMADNGSGSSLATPSMIIKKSAGELLKNALKSPFGVDPVMISMGWGLPRPDNKVEWSMWTSALDPGSAHFKVNFAQVSKALGERVIFQPRFYVLRGADFGCADKPQVRGKQCTNKGRYCAIDPENNPSTGRDGADVVRENLRQLAVHQYSKKTSRNDLWWQYVEKFEDKCISHDQFDEACSFQTMSELSVSVSEIKEIISTSGGYGDSDGNNTLLDGEISA